MLTAIIALVCFGIFSAGVGFGHFFGFREGFREGYAARFR